MTSRARVSDETMPTAEQLARDVLVDRMARAMSRIDGHRGTKSRYQRMARFALIEVEKEASR